MANHDDRARHPNAIAPLGATLVDPPPHGRGAAGLNGTLVLARPASVAGTLVDDGPAFAATAVGAPAEPRASRSPLGHSAGRAALPRANVAAEDKPRYESVKALGEGGVGEVVLAVDNDIDRQVAIKRLRPELRDQGSLLRFADEVRTVGKLEHPSIVPVHDVGVDDAGQHYIVMKYVRGETLESILERLAAGDPSYRARYTYEWRARVFLSILNAIRYAHDRGILHRDIKPANIMVGPHGEVTVMDWGLAKPLRGAPSDAMAGDGHPAAPAAPGPARLLETQQGALLGTPLYMSPEQVAGKGELDERSDIYTLTVMLYEMMTLEHPLGDKQTLEDVLSTILTRDYTRPGLIAAALRVGAPCEYFHYMFKGLARDPAKRFASVAEMESELAAILEGRPHVDCHITFAKRVGGEMLHWIDRHKVLFTVLFLGAVGVGVWGLVSLTLTAVRALT